MKETVEAEFEKTVNDLYGFKLKVELARPANQFGDYATNLALKLASLVKQSPDDIAKDIKAKFKSELVVELKIDGPGFINVVLSDQVILEAANNATNTKKSEQNQLVLVEFGDPNPFKAMHVGHLYSAIAGDSISKILENNGASVKRLSYHGDVGRHVAMWIWAVAKAINWQTDKLNELFETSNQMNSIGYYYALGAKAFESDKQAADEIRKINQQVYTKENKEVSVIYEAGRKLSLASFNEVFNQIGVKYDKQYFESQTSQIGLETVKRYIGKVFEESDKAIVYRGEKTGLHTRVFINSAGLPTYETKDLGLAELKKQDYPTMNKSIVITANEQVEYFKVMLAALAEIDPDLAKSTLHLSHGFLSLSTGKMSSRTGNVYTADQLLSEVEQLVNKQYPESKVKKEIYLAAIKYSFLKQRIGPDIVFSLDESVSLDGNSGPYIQYAHARAQSILAKSERPNTASSDQELEPAERALALKISEYPEVLKRATNDYLPSHICTYLFELAQIFNGFYEKNRVIGHARSATRLGLVENYAKVLKTGLDLLNISAPNTM